jgi:DNA polymerase, archaea type
MHRVELNLGRPEGPPGLTRLYDPPSSDPDAPRRHRYTLAGRELIDTLDAVRRHDFVTRDLPSHRLKDVARHFGVAAPERVYIAGASVFDEYQRDPEPVRRYALGDVAEVDALSQRLLTPVFALAGMAPRRYERLAYAGPAMGILEPILLRGYLRASAAPPRPGVAAGGDYAPHAGGALHLFAEGIAEHVVKADVASLYPSLMIRYAIGPTCDRLGALLSVVQRLTELRLFHKQAARDAQAGSLDGAHHNALQAAMKLVINSAYGYLGAGSMALFADRLAADEITRRGREVLDHVVAELRSRGVALIEADTDGVYFAVPPAWDERRERELVAAVAATLPDGIRLEYEGRYQAMFSHEVKNYALLTYDGRLIVRGAAMRSSRSEPFGERFLVRALRCVLGGDVAGARAAYLETVAALHERRLTAADVATRVRLSKSSSVYARARQRAREAGYEALLASGRTEWERGERVRHYRNRHGANVWLPDDRERAVDEGALRDYDIDYYHDTLLTSYVGRLRKAFAPPDFEALFRRDQQAGLFDAPIEEIRPIRIEPGS